MAAEIRMLLSKLFLCMYISQYLFLSKHKIAILRYYLLPHAVVILTLHKEGLYVIA